MSGPTNEKTSRAGLVSSENNINADSTAKPPKPELDLASWAALGASAKPSRYHGKPNWKRSKTRTGLKSLIVMLALYGLIPFSMADRLIQSGGLRHD